MGRAPSCPGEPHAGVVRSLISCLLQGAIGLNSVELRRRG
jgi:hypothetical protein